MVQRDGSGGEGHIHHLAQRLMQREHEAID